LLFWSRSERESSWRLVVKPKPLVIWSGILISLLTCIGAGFAAYELRQRDISEAQRELRALDILLVEETERSIQSVDLVLQSIKEKFANDGIDTAESFSRALAGRDTYDMLRTRITGMPQLDALDLVGADGRLINISRFYPVPDVNASDRDYYLALKDRVTDAPYLSEPALSRTLGRWNIFLVRRVNGKSGEFVGLVVAMLDLAYFQNLFGLLQSHKGGGVSLWRRDGTLLAYSPTLTDLGTIFKHLPSRKLRRGGEPLAYEVEQTAAAPGRIVAAMSCREFPLVLSVSKTLDEILSDWYQFLALLIAGTLICILAIGAIVWLLVRQFSTYEQLTTAVEERGRAIAQREQAEAQLRQAQKLESIGQLTGGIAHDFNNLLTAVLGNLELLTRHLEGREQRLYNFAKNAFDAANRGANLTQRLLAFSRRQPLDPLPTDLASLLASIGEILRRTLGENVEIAVHVAPDLWSALVDQNQLENAILNIAINARDAMDGRGRLKIEAVNYVRGDLEAAEDPEIAVGNYILLSITDGGKGMEKEVLERVFEPFFSTKPVGRGTGLGLSQVYGFVRQTGGHIRIRSEVGKGTTVAMYLPRADGEEPAAPVAHAPEMSPGEYNGGRILLVEDDEDVRTYTVEILQELGYVVRAAANPRTALELLREDAGIKLLFTDMGLPGMNGRELVGEALRLRPELRVLYMTGYAEDSIAEDGVSEPGASIITKPFTRAELVKIINTVLSPADERLQ
jgi:signal transduction histidine kinase/ActR/RegA family two-component response regulator